MSAIDQEKRADGENQKSRSKVARVKQGDLYRIVVQALEDLKAKEVREIDVKGKASFTDLLIVASGTSTRHVKSIADEVVKLAKKAGVQPLGVEGQKSAEWVLIDLGDIVVNVMLPRVREFYGLERLWALDEPAAAKNP